MKKSKSASARGMIVTILIFLNVIVLKSAFVINDKWYWALLLTIPLLLGAMKLKALNSYIFLKKETH